jgi:hypothetical protein
MATRWFGPRPVVSPFEAYTRHGSCGCCKCGGFDNGTNVFSNTAGNITDLVTYPAYRDGLRIKLVISGVQDAHSIEIDEYYTDITGMSGLNGTWYLSVVRTQYGCIWTADDSELVEINYNIYENYFPYDYNYTLYANIEAKSTRPVGVVPSNFFNILSLGIILDIGAGAWDPGALVPPPSPELHPILGIEFVPTSSEYRQATNAGGVYNTSRIGWDGGRTQDVISGNLKFYKAYFGEWANVLDFDDPQWTGIGDFYDTTTNTFKTAGTFTAELERL